MEIVEANSDDCLNSQLGVEMISVKFAAEEIVLNASILINAIPMVFLRWY